MSKEESYDGINQLQLIEQSLQQLLVQRQNIQAKLLEIDAAAREMAKSDEAYYIVGNIMVKKDKAELETELKSKKDVLEIRAKAIEKQEQKLREKAGEIQKEVLGKLRENKDSDEDGKRA